MKLLYKPFGLVAGIVGTRLARRLFSGAVGPRRRRQAADGHDRGRELDAVLGAAALQGATFAATRAAVDRASAKSFAHLFGIWPARSAPGPTEHDRALAAAAQHEAALGERRERVLEGSEVALEQCVERAPAGPAARTQRRSTAAPARSSASASRSSRIASSGRWSSSPESSVSGSTASARAQLVARSGRAAVIRWAAGCDGAQNSWFSPPKTSLTESSVKIRRIESVSRSAQESTRMLSGAPGRSGIVSVTTICSKPAAARFS